VNPVGAGRHRAAGHLYGRFRYDPTSGGIQSIERVTAGYARWLCSKNSGAAPGGHDRVIYVGDGSSDIHVMLHVNRLNGLDDLRLREQYLRRLPSGTVLSDDAVSVRVPILEDIVGMERAAFTRCSSPRAGTAEWDKVQTDLLTIRDTDAAPPLVV